MKINKIQLCNGLQVPAIGITINNLENQYGNIKDINKYGCISIDIDSDNFSDKEEKILEKISQNVCRENLFIILKTTLKDDKNDIITNFERISKKSNLEYIDLYLIDFESQDIEESWNTLESLYKEKKVKSIGVCNLKVQDIEKIIAFSEINPMVNRIEKIENYLNKELLTGCRRHNIIIQEVETVLDDLLLNDDIVKDLAEKYQTSELEVILKWYLQNNIMTVLKLEDIDKINENVDLHNFDIQRKDMEKINFINLSKNECY